MNKKSWYENRILWKWDQSKLPRRPITDFPELARFIPQDPLITLYTSPHTWTLVTTEQLIASFCGREYTLELDFIQKDVQFPKNQDKRSLSYCLVQGLRVGAPSPEEVCALMSILLMLPLSVPGHKT